jgi:hypothetical protein
MVRTDLPRRGELAGGTADERDSNRAVGADVMTKHVLWHVPEATSVEHFRLDPLDAGWALSGTVVRLVRLTYQRIAESTWRYSSDGFSADLTVDTDLLVTEYGS